MRNRSSTGAGKSQGPGWQDNVQNLLVRSALELDCFSRAESSGTGWGYEGSWSCGSCGALWDHFTVEWRMLAFHERLLIRCGEDPDGMFPGLWSTEIAATAGHEPGGPPPLSLEKWVEFMLKVKVSIS